MTRKQRIYNILSSTMKFDFLEITNNSSQHRVPEGSETHFQITLVSDSFQAISRIERSRKIHHLLNSELNSGLHALSLNLYTPEEWEKRNHQTASTPPCQFKSE